MKNITGIEFMLDGTNIIVKKDDDLHILDEKDDRDLINSIRERISNDYPDAYKILMNWYKKSILNKSYFDLLIVSRFIKCNFMRMDLTSLDIDEIGNYNTEAPICPIAGECEGYKLVCFCKQNGTLTRREREVLEKYTSGKDINEIGDELYLSSSTIHNTIVRAYKKMNVKDKAAALIYLQQHK